MITAIAISPDGQTLAVSGYHEILLDKFGGDMIARLPGLSERIHTLLFTPDGATLAAVGGNPARFGEVQIWDVAARKQKHSVVVSNDTLFGASLSPDGSKLAFGCADKSVRIFDVAAGKEIRKMDHHEDWVFGTVFGVDGKRLVSVSRDRAAKTHRCRERRLHRKRQPAQGRADRHRPPSEEGLGAHRRPGAHSVPLHDGPAARHAHRRRFHADPQVRKAGRQHPGAGHQSRMASAWRWRAKSATCAFTISKPASSREMLRHIRAASTRVQFFPDGSRVVTAGFDGTVRVYDMTGKLEQEFVPVKVEPTGVAEVAAR